MAGRLVVAVGAVHAEAGFEFLEDASEVFAGGVDVLGLGDELHLVFTGDAVLAEDFFEGGHVTAFEEVFGEHGVTCEDEMKFIAEGRARPLLQRTLRWRLRTSKPASACDGACTTTQRPAINCSLAPTAGEGLGVRGLRRRITNYLLDGC